MRAGKRLKRQHVGKNRAKNKLHGSNLRANTTHNRSTDIDNINNV